MARISSPLLPIEPITDAVAEVARTCPKISPFLTPGPISSADNLSIIHLRRDAQIPTILRTHDADDEGYVEGKVVNTRFGSFPHTTLIGKPWGSQILASKVDTGSRGRRDQAKKRKRDDPETAESVKTPKLELDDGSAPSPLEPKVEVEAVAAQSGFIHILPPTPENWTSSLPHRTQVVYTPDYSYILHRLRARPGTQIIEAGAGSGSFTHASARAVYRGYPPAPAAKTEGESDAPSSFGKVWSFEFHEQRHEKLQIEIQDHGLEGIVQITHQDVCENGFLVDGTSPKAEAIFLDLPAPWLALPHLTRSTPPKIRSASLSTPTSSTENGTPKPSVSALNPNATVYLCTFSPCIEQVQKTVSVMRQLGWVDIEMVEISQKRFEIKRERIGIDNGAERGISTAPASVAEAVSRLMEVEGNFQAYHESGNTIILPKKNKNKGNVNSREKILESLVDRKIYKEGNLVHRTEPEVKVHTSYLVFAILPVEWTEEDEAKARSQWEVKVRMESEKQDGEVIGMSKRQIRKREKQAQKDRNAVASALLVHEREADQATRKEKDAETAAESESAGDPRASNDQDDVVMS